MTLRMRHFFSHGAAVAVLTCALPAFAQQQGEPLAVTADPANAQIQTAPRPAGTGDAYWSAIGGYEFDSHETGYGFFGPQYIKPFRPNLAFVGGANVNYLHYGFNNAFGGSTNVRSPGFNTMGGVMFGERNWFMLTAGPSFKRRHIEVLDAGSGIISTEKDWHVGFNVGTSAWYDPTDHNNVFAMYNYETVDEYHWGRLAFKEQLGNRGFTGRWTPYLGVEYIGQGNPDIMSNQFGGFVELAHASSVSVMLRGGWKHSSFDFGPDRTGPWFAIGFYQRIR
jgi:hypothetical protein